LAHLATRNQVQFARPPWPCWPKPPQTNAAPSSWSAPRSRWPWR